MKERNRTQNAMINALTGSAMQVINIILGFVSRTVFIKLLNSDYLGVNGLYSNILTVLSFAELGVGSAIVFSLYKPIADNNTNKIQALMKFYQFAYRVIGISIFVIGLCLVPFLPYLTKDPPIIKESLTVIYILFLFDTAVSYLFSYKKSYITANQKDYIVQLYTRFFQMISIVLQIVMLLLTHEYLLFLGIKIVCTIALNIVLTVIANKMYPFLNEKNDNKLSKLETKGIFDNVKALFVYKFGSVILNGTDNIIISKLIGVSAVGLASNYTMLLNNATNIIGGAIGSLTASVGNLAVKGSKEQIRRVLHELLLLCVWLYGFISIGFAILGNDFIDIWLGDEYLLESYTLYAIVFSIYINGVQYAAYTLRTTQGLFVESRWVPLISALINIVLSVWWGLEIGVAGVFVATGVSRLFTTTIVDPWLVYRRNFNEKPFEYYIKYTMETMAVFLNLIVQMVLISFVKIDGITGFVIKLIILCFSINLVFLLEFGWLKEFSRLKNRIVPLLLNRLNRKQSNLR